jgi:hypothetical protein
MERFAPWTYLEICPTFCLIVTENGICHPTTVSVPEVWYNGRWCPIGSTLHCGLQWPIVPAPGDYDDGEIGVMIDRRNRNTRRKPAPVPLCPPQTPHAARTRTRVAAVGSQRLTA